MITKLIDVGNGKEWQLCNWELVIPKDSMLHMTPEEIGKIVLYLNGMIDETREEYLALSFQSAPVKYHPMSVEGRRRGIANHKTRIYVQLVHRDGEFCRIPDCENVDLEIDHIIPISEGGTNELENLQLLCKHHNCRKGTKSWGDFLKEITS